MSKGVQQPWRPESEVPEPLPRPSAVPCDKRWCHGCNTELEPTIDGWLCLSCQDCDTDRPPPNEPSLSAIYNLMLQFDQRMARVEFMVTRLAGAHVSHYPHDAKILNDGKR